MADFEKIFGEKLASEGMLIKQLGSTLNKRCYKAIIA